MHITPFHAERERLKLKLSFLIQQHFNPAPEYSEKNRCRVCHNFNECRLFFSEYSGTGLKYYWIRNNNFNFSLSLYGKSFVSSGHLDVKFQKLSNVVPKEPTKHVIGNSIFVSDKQDWVDRLIYISVTARVFFCFFRSKSSSRTRPCKKKKNGMENFGLAQVCFCGIR